MNEGWCPTGAVLLVVQCQIKPAKWVGITPACGPAHGTLVGCVSILGFYSCSPPGALPLGLVLSCTIASYRFHATSLHLISVRRPAVTMPYSRFVGTQTLFALLGASCRAGVHVGLLFTCWVQAC